MSERDRTPIDQQWIRDYCDEFVKVASSLPPGPFQAAVVRRVECVQDLVEAWQKRTWPMDERFPVAKAGGPRPAEP